MLTALCFAVLLSARSTLWGLAVLALPGTLAHELTHFITGLVLGAKPVNFSLWPKRFGDHWTLGEVAFRRVGVLNGAFIALAPVLLLPLGWLCLIHVAVPAWVAGHLLWWSAAAYLSATLFYGCLPSFHDLKLGAVSLSVYLTVFALCWLALPTVRAWVH